MPLVFSAICPHPPLLIPNIGRDNLIKLKKTRLAVENLVQDFYAAKPETVIIISPHGQLLEHAFTINHSPVLQGNFTDFGDLETKVELKNDLGLAYKIKEAVETKLPLVLTTPPFLDHGAAIPLFYLTKPLKNLAAIPVGYSLLSPEEHFALGKFIRKVVDQSSKRVALIASADLSHRLSSAAPEGYHESGEKFDRLIMEYLKNKQLDKLLKLDEKLVTESGECGYRSMLILLGAVAEINFTPQFLSYEAPFGVGYLTANLVF